MKRQLESKDIRVKKGSARDATFIPSDPGHVKQDEPRSEGKTRRSRNASSTKKITGHSSDIGDTQLLMKTFQFQQ